MSSLHTAIPTPSFCSFWHGHPYIPIHFLKMFFILLYNDCFSCSLLAAAAPMVCEEVAIFEGRHGYVAEKSRCRDLPFEKSGTTMSGHLWSWYSPRCSTVACRPVESMALCQVLLCSLTLPGPLLHVSRCRPSSSMDALHFWFGQESIPLACGIGSPRRILSPEENSSGDRA